MNPRAQAGNAEDGTRRRSLRSRMTSFIRMRSPETESRGGGEATPASKADRHERTQREARNPGRRASASFLVRVPDRVMEPSSLRASGSPRSEEMVGAGRKLAKDCRSCGARKHGLTKVLPGEVSPNF